MSSNRLVYDDCAYDKKVKQSTSQLDYLLEVKNHEHCGKSNRNTETHNLPLSHRIENENELINNKRYNYSHCSQDKYQPCSKHEFHKFHPQTACESIYGIVPSNIHSGKITSNGLPPMENRLNC